MVFLPALIIFILIIVASAVKICREYERGVVFRLGRLILPPKGPGIFLIIPVVDRMLKISLRTETIDMSSHEFSTMDREAIKLDASISFRVTDPARAVSEVENYLYAVSELARRGFAGAIGRLRINEIGVSRNTLVNNLRGDLEESAKEWGIEIVNVDIRGLKSPYFQRF